MDKTYKLVQWPDSQSLMDNPRFNECIFCEDLEGHVEVGSSAYMVPVDLYNEIFLGKSSEPEQPNSAEAVIKELESTKEKHGDLLIKVYDEDGELCSVIETEVYFEILSPVPATSGSNDPEYRISDLIRDIKDALKDFPNLRVNSYGEDMSYSGYGLFPLESYWLEDEYLVLEGEDHSMDYTR